LDRLFKKLNGGASGPPVEGKTGKTPRSMSSRPGRAISKRYRKLRGPPPPPKGRGPATARPPAGAGPGGPEAGGRARKENAPAPPSRELALFVTHSRDGTTIRRHVEHYVEALRTEGIDVILIVASDSVQTTIPDRLLDMASGVYVRENLGFDFAAWAHIMRIL